VELAGAIAELAQHGLTREFRTFDPATARIVLVQAADRVLPTFPRSLSNAAQRSLAALGVEVLTSRKVKTVDASGADVGGEWIAARTVMWAAGVAASPSAAWLGVEADPAGRVRVGPDLRVPDRPEIFVIGDTAVCHAWRGMPAPGLHQLRSRVAPTQPEQSGLLSPAVPRRRRFATAITGALPRLVGRRRSQTSAGSGYAVRRHGGFGARPILLF
jgi:NADH dehydrogenase FAD-containing subunit